MQDYESLEDMLFRAPQSECETALPTVFLIKCLLNLSVYSKDQND